MVNWVEASSGRVSSEEYALGWAEARVSLPMLASRPVVNISPKGATRVWPLMAWAPQAMAKLWAQKAGSLKLVQEAGAVVSASDSANAS